MKKFYIILGVIIVLTGLILRIWQWQEERLKHGTVKIGNTIIEVEVADTPLARQRGLSKHKSLEKNKGMLFVFPQKDKYPFWMKEMNFPIDIIWISNDRIVDVAYDVPPVGVEFLKTYEPKEPINFVLEVNAGLAKQHAIKVGDKVEIKF